MQKNVRTINWQLQSVSIRAFVHETETLMWSNRLNQTPSMQIDGFANHFDISNIWIANNTNTKTVEFSTLHKLVEQNE